MSDSEIKDFIIKNCQINKLSLDGSFRIDIDSGGVANVLGAHVILGPKWGRSLHKKLSSIPFKFGHVSGVFSCEDNDFESFEFLPYDCLQYILNGNPGFKGLLYKVHFITSGRDRKLYNSFIQDCLDNDIWYEGKTNWVLMEQVFRDRKLTSYENDKKFFSENTRLIDIKDREIVLDFFKIDRISIDNIFSSMIKKFRSNDLDGLSDFEFLRTLFTNNKKECVKVFKKHGILKDILYLFNKMPTPLSNTDTTVDKGVDSLKKSLISKIKRTDSEKEFESNYDTFFFVGRDKFTKIENGDYKRSLEIESLYKIDRYDTKDASAFSMMSMRSRAHPGSNVYFIHIPKGVLTEKSYSESEIPKYLIDLIDQKKTKV